MTFVRYLSAAIAAAPALCSQTPPSGQSPSAVDASTVVTCGRQSFSLAFHEADARVETDEYRLTGESAEAWTQLLTVQRLKPERSASVAQLVEFLQANRESAGWDPVVVEGQGRRACVFQAGIAARDGQPALRVVGLVVDESARAASPNLVVIHFTAKTAADGKSEADEAFAEWKQRLLRQAARANARTDLAKS